MIVPTRNSRRYAALKTVWDSLDTMAMKLETVIADLDGQGDYTVDDIRERVANSNGREMLSDFVCRVAAEFGGERRRLPGAYRSMVNSIRRYNGGKDIRLSAINRKFVEGYEAWLFANKKMNNTVSFYMRQLRAVYNRAIRANVLTGGPVNPFQNVYTGVEQTEKRALDPSQVRELETLDPGLLNFMFSHNSSMPTRMRNSLAMFLFSFYGQGISFVDLAYLRKDNIVGNTVRYHRKKTGQLVVASLGKEMKSIIRYFAPRVRGSGYLFPILKDSGGDNRIRYESALRLQNIRLKKLAAMTGRVEKLSTHAARHSWATIAKNEKVALSVISEALGHTNEKTTRIYLDAFRTDFLVNAGKKIRRTIKKAV